MKKILIGLGVLVGVVAIAFGALFWIMFGGQQPLVDGKELPGNARTVKDGFVGIFVLPAGDKSVALIDCGNDPKGKVLLAELKRRGLGPDAVKAVFLTHGHPDHVAACHLFPQADVYAFMQDRALAAGEERSKGPLPKHMDAPMDHRVHVTKLLEDAVPVQVGDLKVTPYLIPGHTAGSAAFVANGAVYVGDSAEIRSDGTLKPAIYLASDSTEENQASLVKLAHELASQPEVTTVVPAHSGPGDRAALDHFTP